MPPVITARLLGTPEIRVDGNPPPGELLWRKNVALMLTLWFAPERRRTRDQLIGLLWANKDDKSARHSLNEALRVIRRAAGEGAIETSIDHVSWVAAPVLDTDRFTAVVGSDPAGAAAMISGAFCEGFAVAGAEEFDRWLEAERLRWRDRMVAVLIDAASKAEDCGDANEALRCAERAMQLDPYSEAGATAMIRAYWLRGDRAAALQFGAAYRARVQDDLGVSTGDGVGALLARVAREQGRRAGAEVAPIDTRPALIGRDTLMEKLIRTGRDAAARSDPALLIVTGASGAGRSRVHEELCARALLADATVLAMRALDVDSGDRNAAVLGLARAGLHQAPGAAAAAPSAIGAFAARLPDWSDRFRQAETDGTLSLREAFAAIIRAAAEERAVFLAVDDAERLHPDELQWLLALLRELDGFPVTMMLAINSENPGATADDLMLRAGNDVTGVALRLEPWSHHDVERLIEHSLDWDADARSRLARRLHAESAGYPSIAVDLLAAVKDGLSLDRTWPAPDRTLDSTLPSAVPVPLIAAIRLAFRRLDDDARAVLTFAALLDEPFSAERIGRLTQLDEQRRDAALDVLESRRWIAADARGYAFPARARRRLVATEMLTPGQRRRLESRIAECP